jgi:lipopolysaccharide export system permease protein|tara:strand:+ start:1743 stop:2822 length:1080 start_codon:yes stop_codon:yes gene_type:complete
MFKVYQKYLISIFLKKFINISIIFLALLTILGILEEISFFKDMEVSFLYPYFLTLLNAPITLFEIFPFVFLLSTQFLFYDLFKNNELNLLKKNGLSNFKVIKVLLFLSIFIGIFNVVVYYNFASKLKFHYTNIKNNISTDNKYLAMVTESGLWIKDEIDNKKIIIKSGYVKDNILSNIIINEFNSNFELIRTIQSNKIDISKNDWVVYTPTITIENISNKNLENINFKTNFNADKINNLFSSVSTLDLFNLISLKNDYEKLGYSSDEIIVHLLKLVTLPIFYCILTLLSAIVIFNLTQNKSFLYHVILGIFMSVIIYYINFIFVSLGNNGKIPILLSIFFPLTFLSFVSIIGLININDK